MISNWCHAVNETTRGSIESNIEGDGELLSVLQFIILFARSWSIRSYPENDCEFLLDVY